MTIAAASGDLRLADLARRYACAADDAARHARGAAPSDHLARMRIAVDAIWTHLATAGVSWVGFYLPQQNDALDALVLGPMRNTPACSPIGLHGVCGRAFTSKSLQVVADVRELGAGYVACDPRDRSEVVIPLLDGDRCSAVLDLDSHEVGRFGPADVDGLRKVLRAAGLAA